MLEVILVVAIALLIFGPKMLPELGASVGKTLRELRKGLTGGASEEPTSKPLATDTETLPDREKSSGALPTDSKHDPPGV
jgi:sec-independent protein translocase protein TatA